MKILYYSSHPHLKLNAPTGYGRHMREMIHAWKSQGHEVDVLIGGDLKHDSGDEAQSAPVNHGKKAGLKRMIPKIVWETLRDLSLLRFDKKMKTLLLAKIESFNPDIVYERATYLQTSGAMATAKTDIKHILEVNAPYLEERVAFSGKSWLLGMAKKSEEKILENAYGISVVSSALKTYFEGRYPLLGKKITVVPNAVNTDDTIVDDNVVRHEYNLADGVVIGFVGSIFPYHGVDILIEAFSKLIEEGQKVQLLIVGDGMILPEMKSLGTALGLESKIIFTGSVAHDKVPGMISAMDICCMAKSNWYGSPVKIFEYGLQGKAVLAPDEIPVRDVMTDQEAEIVDADVQSVYLGLRKLVDDETYRNRIAENWHQKVLNNYTWNQAAKTTLTLCT